MYPLSHRTPSHTHRHTSLHAHAHAQVGKYEAVGTTEPPIMDGTFCGTVDPDGTVKRVDGTVQSDEGASAAAAAAAGAKQELAPRGSAAAGAGTADGGDKGDVDDGSHGAKRLRLDEDGGANGDGAKEEIREGGEDGKDEDQGEAADDEETQVR